MLGFISESSTINCERRGQIVGIFNLPLWLCTVVGQKILKGKTLFLILYLLLHSHFNRPSLDFKPLFKPENLQYSMLVCWFAGTNDSSTKCLMFQVFSSIISYRLRALKTFIFSILRKNEKNKLKGFLRRILQDLMKKNNT